jgi:tetratricopeptide (TPR) repeat protein
MRMIYRALLANLSILSRNAHRLRYASLASLRLFHQAYFVQWNRKSGELTTSSTVHKQQNIEEQADKLLAQASEIGLSVLNKASLFWKERKERVQKAYEERAVVGPSPSIMVARLPSPIRPTPRSNVVSAPLESIAQSEQHNNLGGAKFKLGQYAEAESAYSKAISRFPSSHLLLLPLITIGH